jgi:hypothetical protein
MATDITQSDLTQLGISGITVAQANTIVDRARLKGEGHRQVFGTYQDALSSERWLAENAPTHPLRTSMQRVAWYLYDQHVLSIPEYVWPEPTFARPA